MFCFCRSISKCLRKTAFPLWQHQHQQCWLHEYHNQQHYIIAIAIIIIINILIVMPTITMIILSLTHGNCQCPLQPQWTVSCQRHSDVTEATDSFFRASDRLQKKKSNFVGFLGTNLRKNWLISWEFCGRFRANFTKKQSVKKKAAFVVIFKTNFARNQSVLCWSDQHF